MSTQKMLSLRETMVTTQSQAMPVQGTKDHLLEGMVALAAVDMVVKVATVEVRVATVVVLEATVQADSPEAPPMVAMETVTIQATVPNHLPSEATEADTDQRRPSHCRSETEIFFYVHHVH